MAFPRRFLFISACKWDWKSFVGWHHVGAGGGARPYHVSFCNLACFRGDKKERKQGVKAYLLSKDANHVVGLEEVSTQHDLKAYHRSHKVFLLSLHHPSLRKAHLNKLLVEIRLQI